jgi:transcriptional regulator with XRE-family HTH domain
MWYNALDIGGENMNLGELIKAYCEGHGLSMQQFAEKCGVSKAYISMLVRGRNPSTGKPVSPTLDTLASIASAIGVSTNDLLHETQSDVPTFYHRVTPNDSDRYKGLADAIVDRLKEVGTEELLRTTLSKEEYGLIVAYRAADPIYRKVAIELLEGHQKE